MGCLVRLIGLFEEPMFIIRIKFLKRFFEQLLELFRQLVNAVSRLKPTVYQVRFRIMPIVIKADHPDFDVEIEVSAVDSEGNVVPNAPLPAGSTLTIAADNPDAFSVAQDPDNALLLHCHVGGPNPDGTPATSNLTAELKDADGNLIAADAEAVVVTAGDPTAITGINLKFPEDVIVVS